MLNTLFPHFLFPNYKQFYIQGFTFVLFTYFIGDILIRINFLAGVIAFFVANLLMSVVFLKMGVGLAGFGNPVLSFISLGLYYIAICLLANAAYKRSFD